MALWRRLFSASYRRARRAEGAGEYRKAAGLYAEAGARNEAATALLFLASRAAAPRERRAAYVDALRWLREGDPRRRDVEVRVARLDLEEARAGAGLSPEGRARLGEAARALEAAGQWREAASAHELLGRDGAAARCLTAAGEVARLEGVLERMALHDDRHRRVRSALDRYASAMAGGARLEAREALRTAAPAGPADVASMLRDLEDRWLAPGRVELRVDGARLLLVDGLPATVGRAEADVPLRGGTLSRRHAELERQGDHVVVRDLGSKNGTMIHGVPIAGEAVLDGPADVGLGDDLALEVTPVGAGAIRAVVVRGLDRGLTVWAGTGLRLPELPARITFPEGSATLHADPGAELYLGGRRCVAGVTLLRGDVLRLAGHVVEVVS